MPAVVPPAPPGTARPGAAAGAGPLPGGPPPPAGALGALPQPGLPGANQPPGPGQLGGPPTAILETVLQVGQQIDVMLEQLTGTLGPDGGELLAQSRNLILQAMAQYLTKWGMPMDAAGGAPPGGGPNPSVGGSPPGFMGGGFTSI